MAAKIARKASRIASVATTTLPGSGIRHRLAVVVPAAYAAERAPSSTARESDMPRAQGRWWARFGVVPPSPRWSEPIRHQHPSLGAQCRVPVLPFDPAPELDHIALELLVGRDLHDQPL